MRVLFFLQNFLPYTSGNGASVMTWAFASELTRAGHEVVICRFASTGATGWAWTREAETLLAAEGIEVVDIPALPPRTFGLVRRTVRAVRRTLRPRLEDFYPTRVAPEAIARTVERHDPDVLYAYDMSAIALLTRLGMRVPILASIVDLPDQWLRARRRYKPQRSRLGALGRLMSVAAERKVSEHTLACLRSCDAVIEHAAHHARQLREQGVPCTYLPNPVPDPAQRGASIGPPQIASDGPVKVAMVGNTRGLATIAGLDFFVNSLLPSLTPRERERFRFHVIGGGSPPAPILQRLEESPCVFVRGHVADIDAEFRTSCFVLVPTPIDLGFRTRIAESVGHGAVVVAHAANAKGMPELQHEENCLLCERPAEFREAFRRLDADADLVARLSANARRLFETHYASRVVGRAMIAVASGIVRDAHRALPEASESVS